MAYASGISYHWDMKDGSGTTLTDIVGGKNLSVSGTTTNLWKYVDRNSDAIANFNGSDMSASASGLAAAQFPSGDWSLLVDYWRARESNPDRAFVLVDWYESGVGGFKLELFESGGAYSWRVTVANGASEDGAGITTPWWHEEWCTFQVVWNNATGDLTLRMNGKSNTQTRALAAPSSANFKLSSGNGAKGRFSDIIFWDGKALSSAEMDANRTQSLLRLRGAAPTVSEPDTQISVRRFVMPGNGSSVNPAGPYTKGMVNSNASKIIVTDTLSVGGGNIQNNFYMFDRSGWFAGTPTPEETATPFAAEGDDPNHVTAALTFDDEDKVHMWRSQHDDIWESVRSTNANSLSPNGSITAPTWDGDGITYQAAFRRNSNGKAYWRSRSELSPTDKWHWAGIWSGGSWIQVGGDQLWDNRVVGSTTWIPVRCFFEESGPNNYLVSAAGFNSDHNPPAHSPSVAYSDDDGTTWYDLEGDTVGYPLTVFNASTVAPPSRRDGQPDFLDAAWAFEVVLDDSGNAHAFVPWNNELEGNSDSHCWYCRWNSTSKQFERFDLYPSGNPIPANGSLAYKNGVLHVWLKDTVTGDMYLLVSEDDGQSFTRYLLDDTGALGNHTNQYDAYALHNELIYRVRPKMAAATGSEVWEFDLIGQPSMLPSRYEYSPTPFVGDIYEYEPPPVEVEQFETLRSFDPCPPTAIALPAPDAEGRIVLNQSGAYYCATQDISAPGIAVLVSNDNITLDMQGFRIFGNQSGAAGGDIGDSQDTRASAVHTYRSWADGGITAPPAPIGNPNDFTIKNAIIFGGTGKLNHGVTGRRAENARLENCWIKVTGDESQPVFFYGSGPLYGQYLTLQSEADMSTTNRHDLRVNASFSCANEPLLEDSVIWGGQTGMIGGGTNSGMRRCVVMHNAQQTNGVCWDAYRSEGWVIEDNVWMPYNGRGLLMDGGPVGVDGILRNNVAMALETPNAEYPQGTLTGNCVKTRGTVSGTIDSNEFLAIGGAPWCGGCALFIRDIEPDRVLNITNNVARGILVGEPGDGGIQANFHVGCGLGFSRQGEEGTPPKARQLDIITGNTFKSNHHAIDLNVDSDAGGRNVNQMVGPGNDYVLTDGGDLMDEWYALAVAKIQAIGFDQHPLVVQRLAEVASLFDSIRDTCTLRADAYHVYAEAQRWASDSSILVDITGETEGPGLTVFRNPGDKPYLVQVLPGTIHHKRKSETVAMPDSAATA